MFREKLSHLIALIILLSIIILPTGRAAADIGPKPELDFTFTLPEGLTIVEGELLVCQDDACTATEPLLEVGPQYLACQPDSCHATLYGSGQRMRLQVTFSNGQTLLSNPFDVPSNQNNYTVEVRQADLLVERQASATPLILVLTLVLCIGLVLLVGALIIGRRLTKR